MQTEATEKDQKFIVMTAHQEDIVWAIQAIEEPAQAAEDDEDYRPQLEPSKITPFGLKLGFGISKAPGVTIISRHRLYLTVPFSVGRKIEKSKLSKAHSPFSKSLKRRKIYATKRSERREHKELTYKSLSATALWDAKKLRHPSLVASPFFIEIGLVFSVPLV
ncbi:hypothetical protein Tco_0000619 [Tanacetum coccineum]